MEFTVEARELTRESSQRRRDEGASRRTVVVARNAEDAIQQYVHDRAAELVSLTHPARGDESIATVKQEDAVFLVRVYTA